MLISDLDTPTLLIDLDVMEGNIHRLADYCQEHGLQQRPHTKTHKVPAIAHRQIRAGAVGISVAKVGEAEVMAAAGIEDIYIAYPVIGDLKQERLARVAAQTSVAVSVDSEEGLDALAGTAQREGCEFRIRVEMNSGFNRSGVPTPEAAVDLAKRAATSPGLKFEGIMVFPGHVWRNRERWIDVAKEEGELVMRTLDLMKQAGLDVAVASGGSTPTAFISHEVAGINEIRAGTYVFYDRSTAALGVSDYDQCAATVLVTVVSAPEPGRVIVDAGSKTFSSDRIAGGTAAGLGLDGHGRIREHPEATVGWMSEEHGMLDVGNSSHRFRVGERLTVIPNHICPVVNLFDRMVGVRGDRVEVIWPILGRGKLQ
jgi:D-serine deaminase-like pyridoxal phosphate-dependent protein